MPAPSVWPGSGASVTSGVGAATSEEPLDTRKEAKQLLREHPEADFTFKEVAETLEEEATAAGTDEGRIV